MIKKITVLAVLLLIALIPNAFANDGGSRPDTDRVTFEFDLISKDVQIGEPFIFEMTVTNHTSREAEMISFHSIFDGTWDTQNADIHEIIIDPYSTKVITVSYIVPAHINWYEANSEYFVDFHPEMYYEAKEVPEGDEDKYDWYDPDDDYWDYVQDIDINIPLKITNIKDGSHLAEISVLDDKGIIGFNDCMYHESATWFGQYASKHVSYLEIENISNADIEDISVFQYYFPYFEQIEIENLSPNESTVFKHRYRREMFVENMPSTINMDFRAIFSVDDEYYCIHTQKEYVAKAYDVPGVTAHISRVYNYDNDTYKYAFVFENTTDKTLENYCIMYIDSENKLFTSYQRYGEHMLFGDFAPGETWEYPLVYDPVGDVHFIVGFMESGTYYYNTIWLSLSRLSEHNVRESIDVFSGSTYSEYIIDTYYLFNDIEISYPVPDETTNPEYTKEPLVLLSDFIATPTPIPTLAKESTEIDMQDLLSTITAEETDSYYIPRWVWIALISAAVVVVVLTAYITIKNNEKR